MKEAKQQTRDLILKANKTFTGVQNKRLLECRYNSRKEHGKQLPSISFKPSWTVNKTRREVLFCMPQKRMNSRVKNWGTNIPLKLIESIEIVMGGQQIERVRGDLFPVLYDLYDIPSTNKQCITVLPFYLSKDGLTLCALMFHEIRFVITLKSDCSEEQLEKFYMTTDVFEEKYILDDKKKLIMPDAPGGYTFFRCEDVYVYGMSECRTTFHAMVSDPVFYFLVNRNVERIELELYIMDEGSIKIQLDALKTVGKWTVFAFVEDLNDINHAINFSKVEVTALHNTFGIKNAKINKDPTVDEDEKSWSWRSLLPWNYFKKQPEVDDTIRIMVITSNAINFRCGMCSVAFAS